MHRIYEAVEECNEKTVKEKRNLKAEEE